MARTRHLVLWCFLVVADFASTVLSIRNLMVEFIDEPILDVPKKSGNKSAGNGKIAALPTLKVKPRFNKNLPQAEMPTMEVHNVSEEMSHVEAPQHDVAKIETMPDALLMTEEAKSDEIKLLDGTQVDDEEDFTPEVLKARCIEAKAKTKATATGVYFSASFAVMSVEEGEVFPVPGAFCPYCLMLKKGETISGDGIIIDSIKAEEANVTQGMKTESDGMFCPLAVHNLHAPSMSSEQV